MESYYLECKFSGWCQHDGLKSALSKASVLSEILDNWECEAECLARACEVPSDQVFTVIDGVEAVLLDGEQVHDAARLQLGSRGLVDLGEALEVVARDLVLLGARVALLEALKTVLADVLHLYYCCTCLCGLSYWGLNIVSASENWLGC